MNGISRNDSPTRPYPSRCIQAGQGRDDATTKLLERDAVSPGTAVLFDGRYRLLRRLGSGGMGEVWMAQDLELSGRRVAIKRMHSEYAEDGEMRDRFRREERVLAQVRSSRFPVIHTTGATDSIPYYVMELVEGCTLSELLGKITKKDGPLRTFRPMDAASIAMQTLEGLACLHAAGYVHRDIKPGNIMINRHNGIRIVDFGTARSVDPSDSLTRTGFVVGTPLYCSPEQLAGDDVTSKSDVYAVGVLLMELLTGNRPLWNVPILEKRRQLLEREMQDMGAGVPRWLVEICRRMLAWDPRDRPRADVIQHILARHVRAYTMELAEPVDTYEVPRGYVPAEDIACARADRRAARERGGRDVAIDTLRERYHALGESAEGRWQEISLLFGDLYYFGTAVPCDWSRAMAWYAASDAPMSQCRMAFILAEGGYGLQRNLRRARRHIDAAHEWIHSHVSSPDVDDVNGLRRSIDELHDYLHRG